VSTANQIDTAMNKLEVAISVLIKRARAYPADDEVWQTRELLEAAREYGRAMQRLTRVRSQ
jgi:hypothetical protein